MANKILIIDDAADDRALMRRVLEASGFAVVEEGSGEEGIRRVETDGPNLAIVDTTMPGVDGFETCRRIKALGGRKTKVMIITGKIDTVDAVKARESGADDYCVKTADYKMMLEAVERILGA